MSSTKKTPSGKLGRPREFDMHAALDQAMQVFWRKGYEGASIADLTAAMGINSPSVYAAFGNKLGLFKAVLDHHDKTHEGFLRDVLGAPTAKDAATRFLLGVAERVTGPGHPPGSLLVQGGLTCGDSAAKIPEEVARHRAGAELALRERFECSMATRELPKGAQPPALARYLIAVANGMCVQASSGASREELCQVAHLALAAWPDPVAKPRSKKSVSSRKPVKT
jgi:AcrR family transcriptional regulator